MTSDTPSQSINAALGTVFFGLGAILAALIFLDRWTEIQLTFPRIWYTSRSFHVAICATLFGLGWWSHRKATAEEQAKTDPIFDSLRFYTKPECSLCDKALNILTQYSNVLPKPELINILDDPELEAKHGEEIPVVEIDGVIRFRGIVSEELLKRIITARKQQLIRDTIGTTPADSEA